MKRLLNARGVGELLGVCENTARKYMKDMTCVILPGGDLRVEEIEVERWAAGKRKAPDTAPARKPRKPTPMPRLLDLLEPDGRIKRRRTAT